MWARNNAGAEIGTGQGVGLVMVGLVVCVRLGELGLGFGLMLIAVGSWLGLGLGTIWWVGSGIVAVKLVILM